MLHEDAEDRVRIDPQTGDIISAVELDHESTSFLRFHVLATDDSADQRRGAASALVIVAVLNVDDEKPVFERRSYSLSVTENQPEMTLVGHVVARDADAPPFDQLRYHLNGGVDAEAFVLDPKTGRRVSFQARSQKLNKEEAMTILSPYPFPLPFSLLFPSLSVSLAFPFPPPLPSPFPSLPLSSRTPTPIAAKRSGGALKFPQRVRVEPGRQTH